MLNSGSSSEESAATNESSCRNERPPSPSDHGNEDEAEEIIPSPSMADVSLSDGRKPTSLRPHHTTSSGRHQSPVGMTFDSVADDGHHINYQPTISSPQFDIFWRNAFVVSLAALFATSILVWLHTTPPPPALGGAIYSTLHTSYPLLFFYTFLASTISLLWIALLRAHVPLIIVVYAVELAVPVVLFSFTLYPLISSLTSPGAPTTMMRLLAWSSIAPAVIASYWIYSIAVRTRRSKNQAMNILRLASRLLSANPALLPFTASVTLAFVIVWTWTWLLMFSRVFLGGRASAAKHAIITSATSWWVAAAFVLFYIWSLGMISGLQRCVIAAVVSQWYFHREKIPPSALPSSEIVRVAIVHTTSRLSGTVSFFSFISLLFRLPLYILPGRFASVLSLLAYSFIPTPVIALTHPLTLSYASIHSAPLVQAARTMCETTFLGSVVSGPTRHALQPAHLRTDHANAEHAITDYDVSDASVNPYLHARIRNPQNMIRAYHKSKLVLHASRIIMCTILCFTAWVTTARRAKFKNDKSNSSPDALITASAPIVGLLAGFIGWTVLGAVEGVLSGVVDAALVCFASELGLDTEENFEGGLGKTYCAEAAEVFGGIDGRLAGSSGDGADVDLEDALGRGRYED